MRSRLQTVGGPVVEGPPGVLRAHCRVVQVGRQAPNRSSRSSPGWSPESHGLEPRSSSRSLTTRTLNGRAAPAQFASGDRLQVLQAVPLGHGGCSLGRPAGALAARGPAGPCPSWSRSNSESSADHRRRLVVRVGRSPCNVRDLGHCGLSRQITDHDDSARASLGIGYSVAASRSDSNLPPGLPGPGPSVAAAEPEAQSDSESKSAA